MDTRAKLVFLTKTPPPHEHINLHSVRMATYQPIDRYRAVSGRPPRTEALAQIPDRWCWRNGLL